MTIAHGVYEISDEVARVDLHLVHSWLTETYWNKGVSRDYVERAMHGSRLVVGAYLAGEQVGYMRVVSDGVTFGWLADVYVDETHRGNGVSSAMTRFALEHPDLVNLKRWLLATRDAHHVYEKHGFRPLPNPEKYMVRGKTSFD